MAFSDLALKAASESAILAAHKNIAKLSLFAKNFSELNGRPGQSIAVPVYNFSAAGAFVAGINDYGTGDNEIGGELITLNQHLVKPVSITDLQEAETGIRWASDTAGALADTLTRGVNAYVFGLINSTNVTQTAETPTTKALVAGLYAVAEGYDIPVDRAVVVLGPTQFASVLGMLDANVYGGSEAVRLGVIEGLYGFKGFVCSSNLPEGTDGAIVCDSAIGVASRYLAPGTEGAYPEVWSATDDDGFTIGYRRFMDLSTGTNKFAADVLFGAKILQPTKIVRLVTTPSSAASGLVGGE